MCWASCQCNHDRENDSGGLGNNEQMLRIEEHNESIKGSKNAQRMVLKLLEF
jgi:hypothetical protein